MPASASPTRRERPRNNRASHADALDDEARPAPPRRGGEIVGGRQRVEDRSQPDVEDAVEHEHLDAHGKNDIIIVTLATWSLARADARLPALEVTHGESRAPG